MGTELACLLTLVGMSNTFIWIHFYLWFLSACKVSMDHISQSFCQKHQFAISRRQFHLLLEKGLIGPQAWIWKLIPGVWGVWVGGGAHIHTCAHGMCLHKANLESLNGSRTPVREASLYTGLHKGAKVIAVPTCCSVLAPARNPRGGFKREPLADKELTCHLAAFGPTQQNVLPKVPQRV